MKLELKFNKKQKVILTSVIIGVAVVILGIITMDTAIIGNTVIIACIVAITPFFMYKYSEFARIKSIESQFPNFVRDLSDSIRSGMSFTEAIKISTKTKYGKLTPEIESMNNRITWGTPFLRALEIFGENLKKSALITEALNIMRESYKAGGDVAATLSSIADDIMMIKEAEAERNSLVKQHVMIMYGVFFMFVGIAIMIIFVMVPMIQSQPTEDITASIGGSTAGFGFKFVNPCPCDEDAFIFPCGLFTSICLFLDVECGVTCYYTALFFCVVIIQGLFTGLIAGQLGENSVTAGTKHSLIMLFSALAVFLFLSKAGLLPT